MAASHPMGGVNAPRPFSLLLNLEARLTLSLSFGWLGDGWWWEGGWLIRPSGEAAITPEAAGYPTCGSAPGDAGPERASCANEGNSEGHGDEACCRVAAGGVSARCAWGRTRPE